MVVASPANPAGVLEYATAGNRAHLSRLAKSGRALALGRGVYVLDATLPVERVVRHHRFDLIAHVWSGAVICDRSALNGAEPHDGWLFVCHPDLRGRAEWRLPGLNIAVRVGPGPLPGDMPMPAGLFLSGPARGLVENLATAGRPAADRPRSTAGLEAVEDRIDEEARTGGAGRIANLLQQLDVISGHFTPAAVEHVRKRLAALLGTAVDDRPRSARLAARTAGAPFDQHRIDMFTQFAALLSDSAPVPVPALAGAARWEWLPFFEAYFSNFIEGTEFGVDEAREIAIEGKVPPGRPKDAHDVAATFRLASDPLLRAQTAASGDVLLELLRDQHAILMAARPEKRPGQFKTEPNYAGGYQFVVPELVNGTLRRGFDCFAGITDPFQRASALMLLITECHPFDDGNGRVARLVANGALSATGQVRIVIPTVYRSNYLAGLSGVSNGAGRGESLLSVLQFAQRWTARIDWTDFTATDAQMHATNAYLDPGQAALAGTTLRLPRIHVTSALGAPRSSEATDDLR